MFGELAVLLALYIVFGWMGIVFAKIVAWSLQDNRLYTKRNSYFVGAMIMGPIIITLLTFITLAVLLEG